MRLIDADAAKLAICRDECGEDAEGCDRMCCNFPSIIDKQPTVDAVPIEPLSERLAWYAMPPVHPRGSSPADFSEAWEEFLRRIDWKEANNGQF